MDKDKETVILVCWPNPDYFVNDLVVIEQPKQIMGPRIPFPFLACFSTSASFLVGGCDEVDPEWFARAVGNRLLIILKFDRFDPVAFDRVRKEVAIL